jgi:hypothetical protein
MKPEITPIKNSGPNPVMSKRIFLDEQEKVCSALAHFVDRGAFVRYRRRCRAARV